MILALLLAQADPVVVLDTELKAAASATAVLQKRCAQPIRADRERDAQKVAGPDIRARLRAVPTDRIFYRSVKLMCGDTVFSHAENWYLPGRLTPDMNRQLMLSDTPYGVVIAPLQPSRRTFEAGRIETGGVLRHRALVLNGQGQPLAYVAETYTADAVTR